MTGDPNILELFEIVCVQQGNRDFPDSMAQFVPGICSAGSISRRSSPASGHTLRTAGWHPYVKSEITCLGVDIIRTA